MNGPRRSLRALIVAPTRELAEQIHEAIGGLGRATKLKSVTIYGGVNKNPQIRSLRQGVDIVVACPGRLLDLADQGEIDFSRIEVLVLDEADRMFDMGFLPDIRKIIKRLPTKRQTLLFSATMPEDIRKLAGEVLHDPVTIRVGTGAPVSTVSHAVYPVAPHLKTALLMKLLERTDTESVLIFARTKHRTTRVAEQMQRAGLSVASLQGNLSQNRRQDALSGFRDGTYQILVATDIAARGIDVSGISHVINYDMPDTIDAYTHRIGRTGRAARTGDAFTFVTPEDRGFVGDIEHVLGERIERRTLTDFDYNVPAPAGGGSDRDRPSFGRQGRPAPVSRYAPVKRGGDSRQGAPRPSGRRSGGRSLEGFSQSRSFSKAR
jgi:ATP-dependent RNA helicase RhlE